MWLRARVVWPVSCAPISDGAVCIEGNSITAVERWSDVSISGSAVTDLGEVILMPGLVNAHCHFDYTDFAGRISPAASFAQWIRHIVALKADFDDAAHWQSWLRGAAQCLARGMTTVANIETRRECLPGLWQQTPLRLRPFIEMILLRADSDADAALSEILRWTNQNPLPRGDRLGISPHAPYTAKPDLLRRCAARLADGLPMTMHLVESAEEDDMFRNARGPLYEMLADAGREMSDCGLGSAVLHADRCGILNRGLIAVHCNYVDAADIDLLAKRGVHVAHCPRSHSYFGHRPFPLDAMAKAGVNVCLGTDSLATVRGGARVELDMFAEMRQFQRAHPETAPTAIVHMATLNAARALSLQGCVGELAPQSWADLIALPFAGPLASVPDAVLCHAGPVRAVMLNGQWIWPSPSSAPVHAG